MAHPYMANSAPGVARRDAGGDRRQRGGGAVRADPGRRTGCSARSSCPSSSPRRRPLRRHLTELLGRNTSLRGRAELPRRRLLPAPRAGDLRRDRGPARVADVGVGHAVLGPGPLPGLVRVLQPARRAARPRLRRPARLQLGLRRRPRAADGGPDDRAVEVLVPRALDPERLAVIGNYCGNHAAWNATSTSGRSATAPTTAASTSTTSWASCQRRSGGRLRGKPELLRRDRGPGGADRRGRPARSAPR